MRKTFNEINIIGMTGYLSGGLLFEDGKLNLQDMYQAAHHQFVASSLATKIGHEINSDFKIGCMLARMQAYPATCNPEDVMEEIKKDILDAFGKIKNLGIVIIYFFKKFKMYLLP